MFINKIRNISDLNRFNEDAKAISEKIKVVIKFGDFSLRFEISEELTTEEMASVDDLVLNFEDQNVEPSAPLIYQYAKAEAKNKHFHNIQYKTELTVRLQKQSVIEKGEMLKVTWFRNMEYQTINGLPTRVYDTPVLETVTSWTRDASGFAIYKNPPVRTWFNEDGTRNEETKVMDDPYFYEDHEQIDEGEKRRSLIIKTIQKKVLSLMAEVLIPTGYSIANIILMGRTFMDEYSLDFINFKGNSSSINEQLLESGLPNPDFGKKTIVAKLEKEGLLIDGVQHGNPDHVKWLNKFPASRGGSESIREFLIGEFSI